MRKLEKGDIIKNEYGTRKVLSVIEPGELYIISCINKHDSLTMEILYTHQELEEDFTLVEPKWEPQIDKPFWYLGVHFEPILSAYGHYHGGLIRANNYFKTESEAQEAATKIRELLKNIKEGE